jgi:hypothetical protein
MTSTDTVHWLQKEMQCALWLMSPVAGCLDWPSPAQADPPELTRTLDDADVKRAIDLAHRRGIAPYNILAVWNAAFAARQAGETENWIADLIDILDSLPPGIQPVKGARL